MTSVKKNGNLNKSQLLDYYWKRYQHQVVLVLAVLLCSFLLLPDIKSPHTQLDLGSISAEDVKSPTDLSVEDEATTNNRRIESMKNVLAIYDFDPRVPSQIVKRIDLFFEKKEKFFDMIYQGVDLGGREGYPRNKQKLNILISKEELTKDFRDLTGLNVTKEIFDLLDYPIFDEKIKQTLKKLIKEVLSSGVVGSREMLLKEKSRGINTLNIVTKVEQHLKDLGSLIGTRDAEKKLKKRVKETLKSDPKTRKLVIFLADFFIQPNYTFNKAATEERKRRVSQSVEPAYFQLKKGEMIIREGERVREDHLVKLKALEKLKKKTNVFLSFCGFLFLVSFLTQTLFFYIKKSENKGIPKEKEVILVELLVAFSIFVIKYSITIGNALASYFREISALSFHYAAPFNIAAITVVLLLDLDVAVLVTMITSLFVGLLMGNITFSIMAFVSGLGCIFFLAENQKRTSIALAGLLMGGINALIVLSVNMVGEHLISSNIIHHVVGCMLGGIVTVSLVSVILPIMESMFNITTDIRLLELSNFNHPLLRTLSMEAPGTYYHSIVLGNIAEAACRAINANYLFARVSAYYHDIGKVAKAFYFIENNKQAEGKHSKLTPRMSSLILISHVKDGVELAKKYNLSPGIIDIIKQHHGTSLMRCFYQKAKDNEIPTLDSVKTADYRYPGPKPQTKEAGVIMLADAVEAASRSLTYPTPSRIESMIQGIVNNIFKDGQLDECELTLKDLHMISKSFSRTLQSTFHSRVDYPDADPATQIKGKGLERGRPGTKLVEERGRKFRRSKDSGGKNLKVQGIRR